jgi:hypothetical protein
MQSALDAALGTSDGLKWFNMLYLQVTQRVYGGPVTQTWNDPAWLEGLDVVFANRYFAALCGYLQHEPVASSWQALFESRTAPGIERIQFALAGMNAHINYDLALALLDTDTAMNIPPGTSSPEHGDFENVNTLLEVELPQALAFLASGILGQAAQDSGHIGQLLAIWSVSEARDFAWSFCDIIRPLNEIARAAVVASQDQITGVLGRSLLRPIVIT